MMSNTGGGHRASAEAIKAAFQEKYGSSYEVKCASVMCGSGNLHGTVKRLHTVQQLKLGWEAYVAFSFPATRASDPD